MRCKPILALIGESGGDFGGGVGGRSVSLDFEKIRASDNLGAMSRKGMTSSWESVVVEEGMRAVSPSRVYYEWYKMDLDQVHDVQLTLEDQVKIRQLTPFHTIRNASSDRVDPKSFHDIQLIRSIRQNSSVL